MAQPNADRTSASGSGCRASRAITSANFTQPAQWRNVEVGIVVEGASLAQSLSAQLGNLVQNGSLREVPLPAGPGVGGT